MMSDPLTPASLNEYRVRCPHCGEAQYHSAVNEEYEYTEMQIINCNNYGDCGKPFAVRVEWQAVATKVYTLSEVK